MLTGVILAGGTHRGMNGRRPSFLVWNRMTLIERQIDEMRKICPEVIIVTDDPAPYLRAVDRSVRIITDYYPGRGPLGGLHAGLTLARQRCVWVAGCHMPFLSAAAASLLLARREEEPCDAVLPITGNAVSPLHGVYDRGCAEAAGSLLAGGSASLSALLRAIRWIGMGEEAFRERGVDPRFTFAIRTGEDYDRLAAAAPAADDGSRVEIGGNRGENR